MTTYDPNQTSTPPMATEPLSSIAASVCLTFGLMALLFLFTGWAPVVLSVLAIVFGYVARSSIRKHNGVLLGRGKAGWGLFLGWLLLLLSLVLLPAMRMQVAVVKGWWKTTVTPAASGTLLEKAEHSLMSAKGSGELGNTIQASGMAGGVKREMTSATEEYFVGIEEDSTLNVYCRNTEDGCCFLIYVPDLSRFDEPSRTALSHMAWDSAQNAAMAMVDADSDLAVGLRDVYRYRSIQLGTVPTRGEKTDPGFTTKDETLLAPFFAEEKKQAEADAQE